MSDLLRSFLFLDHVSRELPTFHLEVNGSYMKIIKSCAGKPKAPSMFLEFTALDYLCNFLA